MKESFKKGEILIIGVNGQDGSFLAESLVSQGYSVSGLGRSRKITEQLRPMEVSYHQCDLRDLDRLEAILLKVKPDLIIHTAAVHGAAGMLYETEWRQVYAVNVASLHVALEYIRIKNSDAHIIYFSSAKVFNLDSELPINEYSQRTATCIYSITKIAAEQLVEYYRKSYGIIGANIWLFNHDSPRKSSNYFLPRLVRCLLSAQENPNHRETFNTLDFYCDWGCAREYMDLLAGSIFEIGCSDFILATGVSTCGRDLADEFFNTYGLNFEDHISCRYQVNDPQPYFVSTDRARALLPRRPIKTPMMICDDIFHAIKESRAGQTLL